MPKPLHGEPFMGCFEVDQIGGRRERDASPTLIGNCRTCWGAIRRKTGSPIKRPVFESVYRETFLNFNVQAGSNGIFGIIVIAELQVVSASLSLLAPDLQV